MLQELKPPDYNRHVALCRWLLHFSHCIPKVLDQVYLSDEAWFHLSSYSNAQNFWIRSLENSHKYRVTLLCLQKIGLWYAMSHFWIIKPFFFFFTATVAAEHYRKFVFNFVSQLNKCESSIEWNFWRLFDFQGSVASKESRLDIPWFIFLWSFLKNQVFLSKPADIDEIEKWKNWKGE